MGGGHAAFEAVSGRLAKNVLDRKSAEFADRGTYALLPESDHQPLRQRMVLLKKAGPVAERFYQYLQEPDAKAILKRQGFEVPQ